MANDNRKGCGCGGGGCPACNFGSFTRNAYWTGKLMLARDFVDEQRYVVDKLRNHNQKLHGTGVVCGLKVVQHETEACRDRFVCVQPGIAIDCCGHDINVLERTCIDLWAIPEINELRDKQNADPHTLQICIRYRECETELVPVLYDECGCSDDKCAPNRILESFDLDVLVDPVSPPDAEVPPKLCGELWKSAVEGCAHCDLPDCVILATIEDWHVGYKIADSNPTHADDTVLIDNYAGRQILPSNQLIKHVIDCILGPVPSDGEGQARQTNPTDNTGGTGSAAAGVDYTHISSVNWLHKQENPIDTFRENVLRIAFDAEVDSRDLDDHSVIVQRSYEHQIQISEDDYITGNCWCEVQGTVECGNFATPGNALSTFETDTTPFNGVQFKFKDLRPGCYRVLLKGDYVRDKNGNAVDANHLPPWVGTDDYKSGDGIEGGLFESWFTLADRNDD